MEKVFPLLFPATYLVLFAVERFLPGRPQPKVPWWALKCVLFFAVGGVLNALVPGVVRKAIGAMGGHALMDLSGLGVIGGAAVALLTQYFVMYGAHRWMHRSDLLWRWAHQLHHSAERVDLAGFAYSHPLQLVILFTIGTVTGTALGVSPHAAMLAAYTGFSLGLFEHLNVRTPRWLGFLVQRPEMHALHHQRGVHAYNFGLPVLDYLFGTYRNPAEWNGEAGFYDGASAKTVQMLLGRDVSGSAAAVAPR